MFSISNWQFFNTLLSSKLRRWFCETPFVPTLLGGDRLGGDCLGDLLMWLGDLTLIECWFDLEREWWGIIPLLLDVGEGVRLVWTSGRACSKSIKRRFCSSINDVFRWTVRIRLLTRAPVGVASFGYSVGSGGPCRGIICIGSSLDVPTGEGEDVIPSHWGTRTSLHICELALLAAMVNFWKALDFSKVKTGRACIPHSRRHWSYLIRRWLSVL